MHPPQANKKAAKPLSPNHVKHLRALIKQADIPSRGGYHPLLVPQAEKQAPAGVDDQMIAAKTGEYIVPQPVVNRKGTQFFDNLVKKTMEELMNPSQIPQEGKPASQDSAPLQGQPLSSEKPDTTLGYAKGGEVDPSYEDRELAIRAALAQGLLGDNRIYPDQDWLNDPREKEFSPEEELKYQFRDKLKGYAQGGQVDGEGWAEPTPIPGTWGDPNNTDDSWNGTTEGASPYGYYGGTDDHPTHWYNPFTNRGGRFGEGGRERHGGFRGGRRHIYGSDRSDELPGDPRWASRQLDPYKQHMPGWRWRNQNLPNYDPKGLQDIFRGGRNDHVTSWIDNNGVHVNASGNDEPGPNYGGTGGISNTSGVGSSDNPSFVGGTPFGTSSNQPTGYDARGNPVWGGQPGGFNIPGGIGLPNLGGGSGGNGSPTGNYDYWGRTSLKRMLAGGDPSLGMAGFNSPIARFGRRMRPHQQWNPIRGRLDQAGRQRIRQFLYSGGGGTPYGVGAVNPDFAARNQS